MDSTVFRAKPRHKIRFLPQFGAQGDKVDSPPVRHWKESVLVNTEDHSALQTPRASPSHQTNGHEDRRESLSRAEESRVSPRPAHLDHLVPGSAYCPSKGGSSFISYMNCNDTDNEYDSGRDLALWSGHCYQGQAVSRRGLVSGAINMAQQEHLMGKTQYRASLCSSRAPFRKSQELDESVTQSFQMCERSPRADVSTRSREAGRSSSSSSSPVTVQHVTGSHSLPTGAAADTFHQARAISHAEQNGYRTAPPHLDDGASSPAPSRSRRSHAKRHKVKHHYDPTPRQETAAAVQECRPVLSRAERMAALERRMMANGLSAPGRTRANQGMKQAGMAGVTHVGAVQMNDGLATSATESSDSEVETKRGNCSSPGMFGPPVEANPTSSIPRNKFSFGSLQLDEEADENDCQVFSDEDIGQIFSC